MRRCFKVGLQVLGVRSINPQAIPNSNLESLMSPRLCLVAFSLLALPASTTAQEPRPPEHFIMPLRADEVINDFGIDVTIIRGSIDWPDGGKTTERQISCDRRDMRDRAGCITIIWKVDPGFCIFLARSVQRRG